MKIKNLEIFKYKIPLKEQVKINKIDISEREGIILRIIDEKNNAGVGEISPIQGLHNESIGESLEQVMILRSRLLNRSVPPFLERSNGTFDLWLKHESFAPSVRFGTESAVLNMVASREKTTLYKLLTDTFLERIPVNALILGDKTHILEKVQQTLKEGYKSLKLKVGDKSLDDDIKIVRDISKLIKDQARLRLDANCAWSWDEAMYFARAVASIPIEYIEEPIQESQLLSEFSRETNLPVAVDESIVKFNSDNLSIPKWAKAVILKPSVIGGIEKTIQLIRLAEQNNISAVISDTFHSGVGLTVSACLAATIIKNVVPMGFDTYQWLKSDILDTTLSFKNGNFELKPSYELSKKVNVSVLEEILF